MVLDEFGDHSTFRLSPNQPRWSRTASEGSLGLLIHALGRLGSAKDLSDLGALW